MISGGAITSILQQECGFTVTPIMSVWPVSGILSDQLRKASKMVVKPDATFFEGAPKPTVLQRLINMLLADDPSMTEADALELIGEAHRAFSWEKIHAL